MQLLRFANAPMNEVTFDAARVVFDRADCRRIAAITNARWLGFTLTGIKHMFCADEGVRRRAFCN
jgi:hypothetical protein